MTYSKTINLECFECLTCGTPFAVSKQIVDSLRKNSGYFYCPSGHPQGWGESDLDRLKKTLDATQKALTEAKCTAANERRIKEQAVALEAEAQRKLGRVMKGVCPCCNRTFANLSRHMQTKHPKDKPTSTVDKRGSVR